LKPDGGSVATSDSGSAGDAALTNRFDEAGQYLLEVRELTGGSVTNAPYRITMREFERGFELRSESNIIAVKLGESAKLKVQATRYDYSGPIELKLSPDVEGITLENATIAEKKNEVEVTLKATEKLAPGFFAHVGFVAQSTNGPPVKLSTVPALRKSFPLGWDCDFGSAGEVVLFHSRQAHSAHAAAHFGHHLLELTHLFHHLLHLRKAIEQVIYFSDGCAAALRNALTALGVEQLRGVAFLRGHGTNDSFHAAEFFFRFAHVGGF
jgi:hypothetical protein